MTTNTLNWTRKKTGNQCSLHNRGAIELSLPLRSAFVASECPSRAAPGRAHCSSPAERRTTNCLPFLQISIQRSARRLLETVQRGTSGVKKNNTQKLSVAVSMLPSCLKVALLPVAHALHGGPVRWVSLISPPLLLFSATGVSDLGH